MVKRERIWVPFSVGLTVEYGNGCNLASSMPLIQPIDWTMTIGDSQEITLMGLIYTLSWDTIIGADMWCKYAITVDGVASWTALAAECPGNWGFTNSHDILHEGIIRGIAAGGVTYPQQVPSSLTTDENVVRVKTRRIINNTQMVNFWMPGFQNKIAAQGQVLIQGKALLLRHG